MVRRRLFKYGLLMVAVCLLLGPALATALDCIESTEEVPGRPDQLRIVGSCECIEYTGGECATIGIVCGLKTGFDMEPTSFECGYISGDERDYWACLCSYDYIWYKK